MWRRVLDRLSRRISFKNLLIFLFMSICVIPILVLGVLSYTYSSNAIREKVISDSYQKLNDCQSEINGYIEQARLASISLSILPAAKEGLGNPFIKAETLDYALKLGKQRYMSESGLFSDYIPCFVSQTGAAFFPQHETYEIGGIGRYMQFMQGDTVAEWQPVETINGRTVIPLFRKIRTDDSRTVGALVFNLYENRICDICRDYERDENELFLLVDKDYHIVSSTVREYVGSDFSDTFSVSINAGRAYRQGDFNCVYRGEPCWGLYSYDALNGFTYVRLIPVAAAFEKTLFILILTISCCLVCAVLCFIVSAVLSKYITEPLNSLIADTRSKAKLKEASEEDIAETYGSYPELVRQLSGTVDAYAFEMQRKNDAEMNNLIFQIKPHYLYNTIFSVICLIDEGDNQAAIHMLSALSEYFRIIISKGRLNITVREEMKHVRQYVDIQQYRYKGVVADIRTDPDILDYMIPKIVLQPIVENAFLHGTRNQDGETRIEITGETEDGDLVFRVKDNGKNANDEVIAELNAYLDGKLEMTEKKFGIGIKNVHERIVMHSGEGYGLHYSRENNCTVATLHIRKVECDT